MGCMFNAPAALLLGKTRHTLYRKLGGPQGRSERVREISPHTGIRSPDRPARSESLYRLSYRGPAPHLFTELRVFLQQVVCQGNNSETAVACDNGD